MRNVWFAWFNFICLLFVVYEHMYTAPHTYFVFKIGIISVPIFAMIAGHSWGMFLKRTKGEGGVYAMKMFIVPYLFWTFAYYILNNVVLDVFIRGQHFIAPSIADIAMIVFRASSSTHLYFLSTLIEFFLLAILLRRLLKADGAFYSSVALIGMGVAIFSVLDLEGWRSFQEYPCWVVPNLCCGILLAAPRSEFYKQNRNKIMALIFLVCGIGIHLAFDSHLSSIVLACSIIALTMAHPKVYAPQWLLNTAPYIMGVYLIHALLDAAVTEVWKMRFTGLIPNYLGWILSVVIFFGSMAIVWLQRKIPLLRECI